MGDDAADLKNHTDNDHCIYDNIADQYGHDWDDDNDDVHTNYMNDYNAMAV